MKNNFLELEFLSEDSLNQIQKFLSLCKDSDWQNGLRTFLGDPETKKNFELTNQYIKQKITDLIYNSIDSCEQLHHYCCPKKIEEILITKTESGGYYNTHTDMGLNGHYSVTLFLSDLNAYEGGELCLFINGEEKKIKLNPGCGIVYETGIPHRVNMVTSGTRYVVVFWIKSMIKDPFIREIRYDLTQINLNNEKNSNINSNIIKTHPDFERVLEQNAFKLNSIVNKLVRRYADI